MTEDYRARKLAKLRREREAVPPPPRALCSGCGATDEHGQPTAHQQGCPIAYVPRGTSAAGSPVGERQGRHPAGRVLKKKVLKKKVRGLGGGWDKALEPGALTRDEVSQPAEDDPEPVAAPPQRRKALPERARYPGGDKGSEWCMGWYVCCARPFYVGYGWSKTPPCTSCGTNENVRKATVEEVHG